MKRAVIVSSSSSVDLIKLYPSSFLVGVEKGIELINQASRKVSLAISDFDTYSVDKAKQIVGETNIVVLPTHKDDSDIEASIKILIERGFDEIVILCSMEGRCDHTYSLLLLLKKYSKSVKIYIRDNYNYITYLDKGEYLINKEDYQYFGIFGFPYAIVSVDKSLYKVNHLELDFTSTIALSNEFISSEAVFTIHEGGALLIRSKEKKY